LHAYQDFYTHSSWAELHQSRCDGCYRDETWFTELHKVDGNVTALVPLLQSLSTYSWVSNAPNYDCNCLPGQIEHGDYCSGINKDSYVRPWFEESYAFAFVGSLEWVYNIEKWVKNVTGGADFLEIARNYVPASQSDVDDLAKSVLSSRIVSYATTTVFGQNDGHWKGPGSGEAAQFVTGAVEWIAAKNIYKNQYQDKQFYKAITDPQLYYLDPSVDQQYSMALDLITPYSQMPANLTSWTKIKVRTIRVIVPSSTFTPNPYAVVQIDDQEFIEAVQIDSDNFSPHWTSIKYVPSSLQTLNISYALAYDKFPKDDEYQNITGDSDGCLNVTFTVSTDSISGDAFGNFTSINNPLNISANGMIVLITLIHNQIGNCSMNGLPNSFCPNEAYTELHLHPKCASDGERSVVPTDLIMIAFFSIFYLTLCK